MEEVAASNVRVAPKTTGRPKKSKAAAAASGPDGDSPQLLHPVSVTIPVGNRHVGPRPWLCLICAEFALNTHKGLRGLSVMASGWKQS